MFDGFKKIWDIVLSSIKKDWQGLIDEIEEIRFEANILKERFGRH